MKHISFLLLGLALSFSACDTPNKELQAEVDQLKKELSEIQSQNMETTKPGLIHNVYFWLKEGISEAEKATFIAGARSLGTVPSVEAFYMGVHADTEARDVVDHSYDLSLVIHFADQAAQDAYQVDPIHLAFIEASSGAWTAVKVYDVAIE
ncbi:MAG: Dabb family protein [Bacteroidia bacterium]|nr:Dabb family protein [Bacteroidia bacterium]